MYVEELHMYMYILFYFFSLLTLMKKNWYGNLDLYIKF